MDLLIDQLNLLPLSGAFTYAINANIITISSNNAINGYEFVIENNKLNEILGFINPPTDCTIIC